LHTLKVLLSVSLEQLNNENLFQILLHEPLWLRSVFPPTSRGALKGIDDLSDLPSFAQRAETQTCAQIVG
jgi:hypothetical protein